MRYLPLILLLLIASVSCKDQPGYLSKNENNGDPIYTVSESDAAMDSAIAKAVKAYPDFLKAFAVQDSGNSEYTVKYSFYYGPGGNGVEYMWLTDLHYKSNKLFGVLDNKPAEVITYEEGDTIEIQEGKVIDWMYVRDSSMVGGFTTRALYNKMSETEKKEFSGSMPYKIE